MDFKSFSYGVEVMRGGFTKYHLHSHESPWPFQPVLHHFTEPDTVGPHCHPWSFTTHILWGGYIERVYSYNPETGTWYSNEYHRKVGDAFRVEANTIHEIIALPGGECWTMVFAEPGQREWYFWRFDKAGVAYRHPNRAEFQPLPINK